MRAEGRRQKAEDRSGGDKAGESVPLVCFDLGRVLVRICDDWQHACRITGIPILQSSELGEKDHGTLLNLVYSYERGTIGLEEFSRQLSPLLRIKPGQVPSMMSVYTIEPYPGAIELVDELRRAGHRTACLSNTNELHWRLLHDRNHSSFFPFDLLTFSFASHLVGHRKPEDEIYQHVERVTQSSGQEIIFFDDVKENIDAASRRGWDVELIGRDSDPVAQLRTHLARRGIINKAAIRG